MKNVKGFAVIEMIAIMLVISLFTMSVMNQPEKVDEKNENVNVEKQQ